MAFTTPTNVRRSSDASNPIARTTVFDLRGLLIEHHGANLRNFVAHGMLSDAELESDTALYLWGLTLRLCFMMIPPPEKAEKPPEGNGAPDEAK